MFHRFVQICCIFHLIHLIDFPHFPLFGMMIHRLSTVYSEIFGDGLRHPTSHRFPNCGSVSRRPRHSLKCLAVITNYQEAQRFLKDHQSQTPRCSQQVFRTKAMQHPDSLYTQCRIATYRRNQRSAETKMSRFVVRYSMGKQPIKHSPPCDTGTVTWEWQISHVAHLDR